MAWEIAKQKHLPALDRFVLATEHRAIVFSSCYKRDRAVLEKNGYLILLHCEDSLITEAVMFTPGGVVIPVLETPTALGRSHNARMVETVARHFPGLYSIMGMRRDVIAIEEIIGRDTKRNVEYYFMAINRQALSARVNRKPAALPPELHIGRAAPGDLKPLLVLQEKYEIEEVCLEREHFSRKACFYNLKNHLVHQVIFKAESGGKMIAKAATNARGYHVDQLGGIYTVKEERNKGIAFALTGALLEYLFAEKEQAVLFVKIANPAAIKLYNNLGFKVADNYRITYYNV